MLSIVIPIYNQDVRKLVYTLAKQCSKLNINYQILCFDDGSEPKYKDKNKELAFKLNINYTELRENLGRSRIRNWLGKAAYFEHILFLDGDSRVNNAAFIKNYIEHLPTNDVLYGGRVYQRKKPSSKKKILHWKYGSKRESLSAKVRKKAPYLNFQSNNFLIPERIFKDNLFDENIIGYGYEDLLYSARLEKKGISIRHIDNTVVHDGLEVNTEFIAKTINAISNLVSLYESGHIMDTRLIRHFKMIEQFNLTPIFLNLYRKFDDKIKESLFSDNPSIILFNIWKLYYFITKLKSQNND